MFGNLAVTAWRSALRDRLHTAINVLGLALGFAVAITVGLYVRQELSYDSFLPDHDRIYRLGETIVAPGQGTIELPIADAPAAALLAADFPEIEAVTRLHEAHPGVRRGGVETTETVDEVDPNFLTVLRYRMVAGDPATALETPESLVLTESAARKWFGRPQPMGEVLEVFRHPMRVTGVLADPPAATHFTPGIMISARAPFTTIAEQDKQPKFLADSLMTYLRVKPGTRIDAVSARLPDFVQNRIVPLILSSHALPDPEAAKSYKLQYWLQALTDIHLHGHTMAELSTPGDPQSLWALGTVAALVLLVAAINFVTLLTARAGRRAVEIGVRKAAGATELQLLAQFVGETAAASLIAMILATAAVELALPSVGAFLGSTLDFPYAHEPALAAAIVALALGTGVAAGFYPALVLSRFRPATVLKTRVAAPGSERLRRSLVVLQFAISIGLVVATLVIHRQTVFATREALRLGPDPIVLLSAGQGEQPAATIEAMRDRIAALPGVRDAAASFSAPTVPSLSLGTTQLKDKPGAAPLSLSWVAADPGYFGMYGLQPLAGRLPTGYQSEGQSGPVVINAAAVHLLGFADPAQAIGHRLVTDGTENEIIGVVPDLPMKSVRSPVDPTGFSVDPSRYEVISVRLKPGQMPETLAAIDRIWRELVPGLPPRRWFLDDRIASLYLEISREGVAFAVLSGIVIVIACLGLFGLSAFTAERRTKEIGVRKALGASTASVVRLLVWQFTRPVVIATAIAWPVAWLVMRRWLDGFASRVELDPAVFAAAAVGALAIAIGTTAAHALQVARSRPVVALRYE